MKGKNVFRVFTFVPYFALTLLSLGILLFNLSVFSEEQQPDITILILLIILLIIMPLVLFLWSAIVCWAIIEINEQGVKKTFFGIQMKEYSWKEIKDIRIKNSSMSIAKWIYFSKSDLANISFLGAQMRRDTIKLVIGNPRIIEVVKKYAPAELVKEIENGDGKF